MSIQIALLRGINVGGRNLLAMSSLKEMLESLGFGNVRSFLQSGNLTFDGGRRTAAQIETLLEAETEKRLGSSVDYFVRSNEEWAKIIVGNPFTTEAERDPGHLVAMFLRKAPHEKDVQSLQAASKGPEIIRLLGRQLYIVYPDGIGRSKLTNVLIEKKLGIRGTARNWNTVLKLAAASREPV